MNRSYHSMPGSIAVAVLLAALVVLGTYERAWPQGFPCVKWPALKADLVNNRMALQVTASPSGETWTVMLVGVDGIACVISAGKGWEPGVNPVKGEGRS